MNHDDFAFGAPEPLSTAEAAELANTSDDWPKKLVGGVSTGGEFYAYDRQLLGPHGTPRKGEIEMVCYPADQAPEPVAWRYRDTNPALGPEAGPWNYHEAAAPLCIAWTHHEQQPLYLAPPSESAIRASERERCAKLLDHWADLWAPSPLLLEMADRIRELGDGR